MKKPAKIDANNCEDLPSAKSKALRIVEPLTRDVEVSWLHEQVEPDLRFAFGVTAAPGAAPETVVLELNRRAVLRLRDILDLAVAQPPPALETPARTTATRRQDYKSLVPR